MNAEYLIVFVNLSSQETCSSSKPSHCLVIFLIDYSPYLFCHSTSPSIIRSNKSILAINQATAEGLRLIKEVGVDKGVLSLKAFETLEKMANGTATKIIIPSELQGLAGLAISAKEVYDADK